MINKKDICNELGISYYLLRKISTEISQHIGMSTQDFINHRGYFDMKTSEKIRGYFGQ